MEQTATEEERRQIETKSKNGEYGRGEEEWDGDKRGVTINS